MTFDIHIDVFLSEVLSLRDSADLPLPTGFTVITIHPSAGEVPPGWGPQCGAASVNIPISFWSWAVQSVRGRRVLSQAGLSLFPSVVMMPHHTGLILKTAGSITHLPNTRRGEFTPRKSEVKTG
jgi:hypothetical protein